jgi:hypothetical protein
VDEEELQSSEGPHVSLVWMVRNCRALYLDEEEEREHYLAERSTWMRSTAEQLYQSCSIWQSSSELLYLAERSIWMRSAAVLLFWQSCSIEQSAAWSYTTLYLAEQLYKCAPNRSALSSALLYRAELIRAA